jgi:hypothetical protein
MRSGKAKRHSSRKSPDVVRVADNSEILKICEIGPLRPRTKVHNGEHFNDYASSNITKLVKSIRVL